MFQKDLFKGKRILVTGGGTGLGKAMSAKYLQLGADIYICGRRKSVLDECADEMMNEYGKHKQKNRECTLKYNEGKYTTCAQSNQTTH